MSRFSIDIALQFNSKRLRRRLTEALSREVNQIFNRKKGNIVNEIRQIIVTAIARSDAFKGLLGGFPNDPERDLQAHFGLNTGTASAAGASILEIAAKSVRFTTNKGTGIFSINIRAIEDSFSEFLNVPGGTFISEPSGSTVPWITWLLVNPNIDIPQGFNIVFANGLSSQELRSSRSGRALMRSLDAILSNGATIGGIYAVPGIGRGGKQNFIFRAIDNKAVQNEIINVFVRNLGLRRS
jgi:hypothetical protein